MYAVKAINRGNRDGQVLDRELSILRVLQEKMHDENVVRVVDLYEESCLIYIVMEYMGGGDLCHRLGQKRCFTGMVMIMFNNGDDNV